MDSSGAKRLTIKVNASFGDLRNIGGVPTREKSEVFELVNDVVIDPYSESPGDYTVDDLICDFQDEWDCKVSYLEDTGSDVREFEIFEPSYDDAEAARDAASNLLYHLADYAQGHPTGR